MINSLEIAAAEEQYFTSNSFVPHIHSRAESRTRSREFMQLQPVPTFPCATGSATVDRETKSQRFTNTGVNRAVWSWNYKHRHRWSARYTRVRVSQSQYLGQGQKVLRSPVRRDTGESLARRARCTFTSPVLPCAFANCNSAAPHKRRRARFSIGEARHIRALL